jgi:hypothetical protein
MLSRKNDRAMMILFPLITLSLFVAGVVLFWLFSQVLPGLVQAL